MPAQTQILTGIGAVLYKNSGSYGTPTWGAQNIIRSVSPAFPWDFADAPSRATPIKIYGKVAVDLAIQVMMRADPADANYAAWVDAHWSRTAVLDLLILNAKLATEGARGLRGEFLISLSGEPQEIDGTIFSTFDIKPTITTNGLPKSAVMGASSTPTFTDITV
ncbi:unnamed protein product [Gemmata massiliana]|uniref:Uncharacterized protein n=1 Tax=Gemmata massiliana TaxID=1210884 RepID=A0A6P2D4P4_9BACT|nr:hypothetical protein [Gemmata massiliana]VTR96043.1 unnamed protein product [Gemmata massiliana]